MDQDPGQESRFNGTDSDPLYEKNKEIKLKIKKKLKIYMCVQNRINCNGASRTIQLYVCSFLLYCNDTRNVE